MACFPGPSFIAFIFVRTRRGRKEEGREESIRPSGADRQSGLYGYCG